MSSVLKYEYKPFVDSSDEDSDGEMEVVPRKRNIVVKNEGVNKKNKLMETLSDSDDGGTGNFSRDDDEEEIAAEIIAKRELEARRNAQLLLQSISNKDDKPIDADDVILHDDTNDLELEKKLKKIKETMENTKKQLNTRVNKSVKIPTTSQVIFLDGHSNLPKIKTAFERATERKCMEPMTIDMLGEYVPHSQDVNQCQITDNEPVVKVKTRLNDSSGHIWKWKLLLSKTMGNLKSKLEELYKVPTGSLKLSFDGEAVADNVTPESLGLTDDDIVEVRMSKELHASAVNHAKACQISADADANSAVRDQSQVTDNEPVVKVKTRLNDSSGHIWKWKLLLSKTMGNLKSKLEELYKVPTGSLKLSFDGEAVADNVTPESLGLTDDDIVEVRMSKELHASAVNHAKEGQNDVAVTTQNSSSQKESSQVRTVVSLHLHLDKDVLKESTDEEIILKLNVYTDFTIAVIHSKIRSYFSDNESIGYYSYENPLNPIDMNTIIRDVPPTSDTSYITVKAIQPTRQQAKKGKKPAAKRKSR